MGLAVTNETDGVVVVVDAILFVCDLIFNQDKTV